MFINFKYQCTLNNDIYSLSSTLEKIYIYINIWYESTIKILIGNEKLLTII